MAIITSRMKSSPPLPISHIVVHIFLDESLSQFEVPGEGCYV